MITYAHLDGRLNLESSFLLSHEGQDDHRAVHWPGDESYRHSHMIHLAEKESHNSGGSSPGHLHLVRD
jgi:hypothetical protein